MTLYISVSQAWQLDLVMPDEAARMSEALPAISMAKFPEAAFILIGDTKH